VSAGSSGTSGAGAGSAGNAGGDGGMPDGSATDTCDDDAKNGSETDTDCGGPCGPCADGDNCLSADDCQNGYCSGLFECASPACDDGDQNGTETDEDCGGDDCAPCMNGRMCEDNDDCASNACTDNECECLVMTADEACDDDECGMKSDGCGGMVTCPLQCESGFECTSNACTMIPPMCVVSQCPDCDGFLAQRCCIQNQCGCDPLIGSCSAN
jgi:hypothetical protein